MTPKEKIMLKIIATAQGWSDRFPEREPSQSIEDYFSALQEGENGDSINDAINEVRCMGQITGLDRGQWSRHYEWDEVALEMSDGSWVGWTYWHGGGKHGEPQEIDWLDQVYEVKCTKETRVVNVFSEAS